MNLNDSRQLTWSAGATDPGRMTPSASTHQHTRPFSEHWRGRNWPASPHAGRYPVAFKLRPLAQLLPLKEVTLLPLAEERRSRRRRANIRCCLQAVNRNTNREIIIFGSGSKSSVDCVMLCYKSSAGCEQKYQSRNNYQNHLLKKQEQIHNS